MLTIKAEFRLLDYCRGRKIPVSTRYRPGFSRNFDEQQTSGQLNFSVGETINVGESKITEIQILTPSLLPDLKVGETLLAFEGYTLVGEAYITEFLD